MIKKQNEITEQGSSLTVKNQNSEFLSLIHDMALNPSVDPAKMQAILDVQERMMNKQAEQEFNAAMMRIQDELPRIKKDKAVEYDKDKNNKAAGKYIAFKHATYENLDKVLRPLMQREGLRLNFTSEPRSENGGGAVVTATLTHKGGHRIEAEMSAALDTQGGKSNLQGMGSTISYCRRTLTKMLFNIIEEGEDNDGAGAPPEKIETNLAVEIDQRLRGMADYKSYLPKFLHYMKVEEVRDISTQDYMKAVNCLDARDAVMKKAADQKGGNK